MGVPVSLVLDCADPLRVGAFWRQALGYQEADPPDGYASWAEAAAAGPAGGIGYVLTDPDGTRPSLLFQVVPEPKASKNRLHIDIRLSEGAPRPSAEEPVVRRNQDPDDWFVVLQDPEGNEFCLV